MEPYAKRAVFHRLVTQGRVSHWPNLSDALRAAREASRKGADALVSLGGEQLVRYSATGVATDFRQGA